MYGTVARFRLKPGCEAAMVETLDTFARTGVGGFVAVSVYRLDRAAGEYMVAAAFASKAAYEANSNRPEQHAQYLRLRDLMVDDPVWHDGAIIHQLGLSA